MRDLNLNSATKKYSEATTNTLISAVYTWMTVGLAITAGLAMFLDSSGISQKIAQNPGLFLILIIIELILVFTLSSRINKMSAAAATLIFVLYSALNGLTISPILLYYTKSSVVATFFICSGTFATCSIYGWITKNDLTSMGGFLLMGLIGLIIAMVVNAFIGSSAMDYIISLVAIVVFVGLTAYDTQKIKEMGSTMPANTSAEMIRKGAIMGALSLYLDFINLFLHILRIFGGGGSSK